MESAAQSCLEDYAKLRSNVACGDVAFEAGESASSSPSPSLCRPSDSSSLPCSFLPPALSPSPLYFPLVNFCSCSLSAGTSYTFRFRLAGWFTCFGSAAPLGSPSNAHAHHGNRHATPAGGWLCDRCLQVIDEDTFNGNLRRLQVRRRWQEDRRSSGGVDGQKDDGSGWNQRSLRGTTNPQGSRRRRRGKEDV